MIEALEQLVRAAKTGLVLDLIALTWQLVSPLIKKLIRPWSKSEIDIIVILDLMKIQMSLAVIIILVEGLMDVM